MFAEQEEILICGIGNLLLIVFVRVLALRGTKLKAQNIYFNKYLLNITMIKYDSLIHFVDLAAPLTMRKKNLHQLHHSNVLDFDFKHSYDNLQNRDNNPSNNHT